MNSLTECRKTQSRHADVLSESDDLQARLADLADATGDPRLRQLGQDISAICWELAERGEGDAALAALVDRFPGVAAAAGQRERPWLDPRVDGDFWDDGHLADVLVLQPGEAGRPAPPTGSDAAVYAYA